MPTYRSDQGRIHLSIPSVKLDTISWDKFEGGDIAPEMTTYTPGGMQPAFAMGGLRKRSDATVSRIWSDFLLGVFIALDNASGIAPFTCSYTAMMPDRITPAAPPIVYTGIVGQVTRPGYDSTASTPAMLQLTLSCDEAVTQGGS